MNSISKSFLVVTALLFFSAFMPYRSMQAQIFDGTVDNNGNVFGLCIGLEEGEGPEECADINCDDEGAGSDTRCIPESQAGTALAENTLASSGITHTDNLGDFIKKIVNFSLPYLTLAAFLGYVAAGFLYVTALGNEEQISKAKNIIIWSSVGLILVILSFAITNLFTGQLVDSLQPPVDPTAEGGGNFNPGN